MDSDYREPNVTKLLEKLEDLSYSESIAFGQQNAAHIGVTLINRDGTSSDVYNLCGKQPAIVGIDTLSFYGYEGKFEELVKVVKQLNKQGVVITLSSHMPNFSLGEDDFYDYSPNITDGQVGGRILPGGDLHSKYVRFLNRIAEFCEECIDVPGNRIPMIFRPFHECNGSWFWWGAEHLNDDKFITLYRFTIDYLRFNRGIRNLLFAYSPNGPIYDKVSYLRRYPGDDYVDILGLDFYDDKADSEQDFFEVLKASLKIVYEIAEDKGKVCALTETGLRMMDTAPDGKYYEGLAPSGNRNKKWFTNLLDTMMEMESSRRCCYILTWGNFSETQFWVPYATSDFRHEMCDDFVEFVNDKRVVMAPM